MQSRKSLLAKIFGAFCALLCVIALAFGLAACDSNSDTVKSVVGMSVENGQLVLEYSDGSTETIDLGDLKGDTGDTGATGPQGPEGPQGDAGRGIVSVAADENGNLVITYTDGTTQTVEMPAASDEDCEHAHISWYKLDGYAYIATTNTYEGTLLEVCDDCGYAWLWKNEEHVGHHVWEVVPEVKPGCSTPGHTAGTVCEVCGAYGENTTEIPATGNHAWDGGHLIYSLGQNVCEEGGQYIYLCTNDNCDAYKIEGETRGHSVASLVTEVEPTVSADGYATGKCTVCGEDITVVLPKLTEENIYAEVGADGEPVVVNENGTYVYTPFACDEPATYAITIEKGDVLTVDGVKVTGEVNLEYTGDTAYTDEFSPKNANGDEIYGHTVTTEDGTTYIIRVTDYNYDNTNTVYAEIYEEHDLEEPVFEGNVIRNSDEVAEIVQFFVNVPQTCEETAGGFQAYIQCDVATTHTMLVFYSIDHQFVEDADGDIDYEYVPESYTGNVQPSAPTCQSNGYAYCTVCEQVREVPDSKLAHGYTYDEDGNIVYSTAPTCKTDGYSLCPNGCGEPQQVVGSKLGHNIVIVGTPNIDQTTDTFELSFYCTRGDLGSAENPVEISGKYSELVANGTIVIHEGSPDAPTCDDEHPFVIDINRLAYRETDGTITYITEEDITIMAGHSWPAESGLGYINEDYDGYAYNLDQVEDYIGNFVNVPPANCKETAYAFVYCDVCDAPVLISVRGTHQNTTVVSEATHSEAEIRHCNDCGAEFYVGVPETHTLELIDNDATNYPITLPTATSVGYAYYRCTDEACGEVVRITLPTLNATEEGEPVWTVTPTPATCEEKGSTVYSATFDTTYTVSYDHTYTDAEGVQQTIKASPAMPVTVDFDLTVEIPARGHDEFVEGTTIVYSWYNPETEDGTAYVGYICTGCNRMMVLWSELEGTECPYEVDVKLESPQIPGIVFPPEDQPVDPEQPGEGGEETPEDPGTEDPAEPVEHKYSFSYDALTDAIEAATGAAAADKTQLDSAYFTGENSFLTVTVAASSDQYRTSGSGCFEIKNGTVSVTFEGTGTLTLKVSSTGSSNTSAIALRDADGNYVAATTAATAGGWYEVTGTTYVELVFNIDEAGTYTIVNPVDDSGYDRGVRIQNIDMVDIYAE